MLIGIFASDQAAAVRRKGLLNSTAIITGLTHQNKYTHFQHFKSSDD